MRRADNPTPPLPARRAGEHPHPRIAAGEGPVKKGRDAMPKVRCTVSNCFFWDEGNRCGADEILIVREDISRLDDDSMEIADIGYTPAAVSTQTSCKTFRPREQSPRDSSRDQRGRSG